MQVIACAEILPTWNHTALEGLRAIRVITQELSVRSTRCGERLYFDDLMTNREVDQIAQGA